LFRKHDKDSFGGADFRCQITDLRYSVYVVGVDVLVVFGIVANFYLLANTQKVGIGNLVEVSEVDPRDVVGKGN
jgi:hypothetical protein